MAAIWKITGPQLFKVADNAIQRIDRYQADQNYENVFTIYRIEI